MLAAIMSSLDEFAGTLEGKPNTTPTSLEAYRAALSLEEQQRYQSKQLLGEGGMGAVWLYDDQRVGRSVAFKMLRGGAKADEYSQHRFMREARVQAMIEHPAVVPVYDVGCREDGTLYFTMRRINGRTLEEVLRALAMQDPSTMAGWSRRKLLSAFIQVCQAVHFAHLRGVVHRDLKPSNVMLGAFGEVYVLDWGIAKVLEDPSTDELPAMMSQKDLSVLAPGVTPGSGPALTRAGAVLGTPGFIAPELLDGTGVPSACSDVYSLGAILFELLTLQPLHEGNDLISLLNSNLDAEPRDVLSVAPDIAPELAELCRRATERNPEKRIENPGALAAAIERFLDGDRDQERRRAQAEEFATTAAEATQRALAPETSSEQAQKDRGQAMRLVLQSLALDPQQESARASLLRLLLEVPAVVPKEVEDDIVAAREKVRLEGTKQARWALLLWVGGTPFCAAIGIRWKWFFVAGVLFNLTAFAITFWAQKKRDTGAFVTAVLAIGIYGTIMLFSAWMGPFVFVPTAAAVTTLVFILNATERERPWFIALGAGSAAGPLLAQWIGLLPRQFEFRPEGVLLRPGAMELPEWFTLLGLLVIAIGYSALPAVFVAQLNAALVAAQRQLFLQAWQLRHSLLKPAEPRK